MPGIASPPTIHIITIKCVDSGGFGGGSYKTLQYWVVAPGQMFSTMKPVRYLGSFYMNSMTYDVYMKFWVYESTTL